MNMKRFFRVLAGQALAMVAVMGTEALGSLAWPPVVKVPVMAAMGALINAAAKGARERKKRGERALGGVELIF